MHAAPAEIGLSGIFRFVRGQITLLEAQQLRLNDTLKRGDLGHELGRDRLVDLDQRDRRAAGRVAAEMEGRDVDLALAQQRAEAADEARLVVVGDVEHVRGELGLDLDALDVNDARMLAAEQRERVLNRTKTMKRKKTVPRSTAKLDTLEESLESEGSARSLKL
jgi:hypothetical protein